MKTFDLAELDTGRLAELKAAFADIQMPRSPYVLEHFVAGQHDTAPARYAQTVLELQSRYYAIERARITRRQVLREIGRLQRRRWWWPFQQQHRTELARLKQLDLEQQDLATLGAVREAETLFRLWKDFDQRYSRTQLDADQPEYWRRRLTRQARQEVLAQGRVGVGNQEALAQIGLPVRSPQERIADCERRYLEVGNTRLLIVVPTLMTQGEVAEHGLACLEGWTVPGTIQHKPLVICGQPVAAAYHQAARQALADGADYLLCVEDDLRIPPGAFERLWELQRREGPRTIVGGWYPLRSEPRRGAPIVVRDGRREYLEDDGEVHEVYSLPQGFTLIPVDVFREIPEPWFETTSALTQDSFFSQCAREAGYRLLCDTGLRCRHVDRETGRVYF